MEPCMQRASAAAASHAGKKPKLRQRRRPRRPRRLLQSESGETLERASHPVEDKRRFRQEHQHQNRKS